ncbi:MAG: chemotaxis protein CheW [Ktedonobacteraceae bacterium]|nr:chemotaxis protein CheW [Ktedonobacteraceae bacterium]
MSSEDLKTLQRDAFAAIQQLMSQSPSIAALQMQLAQSQIRRVEGSGTEPPSPPGEKHLLFTLAGCEFAVKAECVQGVERLGSIITPVPNVVPWVKGVINLRGTIASVVDLRMFLNLGQVPQTPRTRLLSLQYNEMVICFVVDGVSEMLPIPASAVISGNARQANIPSWAVPYAAGSALLNGRAVVLLDVARLLFSEKMQHYQALG